MISASQIDISVESYLYPEIESENLDDLLDLISTSQKWIDHCYEAVSYHCTTHTDDESIKKRAISLTILVKTELSLPTSRAFKYAAKKRELTLAQVKYLLSVFGLDVDHYALVASIGNTEIFNYLLERYSPSPMIDTIVFDKLVQKRDYIGLQLFLKKVDIDKEHIKTSLSYLHKQMIEGIGFIDKLTPLLLEL